jgi:hypothetical protein
MTEKNNNSKKRKMVLVISTAEVAERNGMYTPTGFPPARE